MAVDDAIETYFICQLQNKPNCISLLTNQLQKLRLTNIQIIRHQENKPHSLLELKALTSYSFNLHTERTFCHDLDIKFTRALICEN